MARRYGARQALAPDSPRWPVIQSATRGRGLDAAVVAVPVESAVEQAGQVRGAGRSALCSYPTG